MLCWKFETRAFTCLLNNLLHRPIDHTAVILNSVNFVRHYFSIKIRLNPFFSRQNIIRSRRIIFFHLFETIERFIHRQLLFFGQTPMRNDSERNRSPVRPATVQYDTCCQGRATAIYIDKVSRFFFPFSFLILNVVYWSTFL